MSCSSSDSNPTLRSHTLVRLLYSLLSYVNTLFKIVVIFVIHRHLFLQGTLTHAHHSAFMHGMTAGQRCAHVTQWRMAM